MSTRWNSVIITEEKTKYMQISKEKKKNPAGIINNNNRNNIQIDQYAFECVDSFKYLGTLINTKK